MSLHMRIRMKSRRAVKCGTTSVENRVNIVTQWNPRRLYTSVSVIMSHKTAARWWYTAAAMKTLKCMSNAWEFLSCSESRPGITWTQSALQHTDELMKRKRKTGISVDRSTKNTTCGPRWKETWTQIIHILFISLSNQWIWWANAYSYESMCMQKKKKK